MPLEPLRQLESSFQELGSDAVALAEAHLRLARLEGEQTLAAAIRFAVLLSITAALLIAGVAVGTVALGTALDGVGETRAVTWWWLLAAGEMATGVVIGGLASRGFRRQYVGFVDTMSELRSTADALGPLLGKLAPQPTTTDLDRASAASGI